MKRVLIHPDRCQNCGVCPPEINCSEKAIFREEQGEKPWVDFFLCRGCLLCKPLCTGQAIEEIRQPCNGRPRKGW